MEKENARKQTLEQLHERRKQVIRLHKKAIKIMEIVSMTGLSYPAVRATIDLFVAGGWAVIRPTSRGRARGDGRCLSEIQEDTIRRVIIDKRPEQLKMDFFLWSRAAVGQLIEQEYGIKLHIRSVGKYLARWGFTPQKPIKRAYEQNPRVRPFACARHRARGLPLFSAYVPWFGWGWRWQARQQVR
jgi:transposase